MDLAPVRRPTAHQSHYRLPLPAPPAAAGSARPPVRASPLQARVVPRLTVAQISYPLDGSTLGGTTARPALQADSASPPRPAAAPTLAALPDVRLRFVAPLPPLPRTLFSIRALAAPHAPPPEPSGP